MKLLAILAMSSTLLLSAVDINSATVEELATLNGIGEKKAEAILEYSKNKCFEKVEDLAAVKGISSKTIEKNRENIKVGACKK